MRILQVSHGFPPDQAGGTERYTWHLAHALSARGHAVSVFTRGVDWRLPEYAQVEQSDGEVRIIRVNNTWKQCGSFEESYQHPAIADRFGAWLDEFRPDIVHLQHLAHLSTRLPQEARKRGIPVVMTFHDYWLMCNQGQLLRRDGTLCGDAARGACTDCAGLWLGMGTSTRRVAQWLGRWWPDLLVRTSRLRRMAHGVLRLLQRRPGEQARMQTRVRQRSAEMLRAVGDVTLGIAPSQTVRDQLVAFGVPAQRLRLLSYGIPTRHLANVTRSPGRVLRVAYLGRAIPAKGVHVLLEAAAKLNHEDIQITIHAEVPPYGDVDDYAKRMRRRAAGVRRVRWAGGYAHDQLSELLAVADVVVVPSVWYENQPLVILEAQAAHVPVVATDLGGMRELVQDGRNGLLFPRADAQALARCLRRLADDRQLLERLGDGISPVHDLDTHVLEIESIYADCGVRQADPMAIHA